MINMKWKSDYVIIRDKSTKGVAIVKMILIIGKLTIPTPLDVESITEEEVLARMI